MGWLGCIVDEDDPQNYEKWKPKRGFFLMKEVQLHG